MPKSLFKFLFCASLLFSLLCPLFFQAGLVLLTKDGEALRYSYSLVSQLLTIVVCLMLLLAGLDIAKDHKKTGFTFIALSVFVFAMIFPGTIVNRVEISQNHFSTRDGLWFLSQNAAYEFRNVEKIGVATFTNSSGGHMVETKTGSGWSSGGSFSKILMVYKKTGEEEEISVGILMNAAFEEVLNTASHNGVHIFHN